MCTTAAPWRRTAAASANGLATRRASRPSGASWRPSLPTWKCTRSKSAARREPSSAFTCVVTPLIASRLGAEQQHDGRFTRLSSAGAALRRCGRLRRRRAYAERGVELFQARHRALGREAQARRLAARGADARGRARGR